MKKEFSQDVFASKIGIHVTNLSKYERGISIPSLEVAEKIATELNISLDQLVYGDNKAENIIKDNELLSLFVKHKTSLKGKKQP
ncbi:helix-turn-helix domain-containing protein [Flavobacterium sp. JP2137]|uniref:helix-turn-helix domain-containing protein n=1 Tax=Flavobacterium sp. JP2137 TaxID=3414510 RepID=UPI003D2FD0D8